MSVADAEKGLLCRCIICKVDCENTRALARSHAAQYGLREEDIQPGARVCNTCRCKSVRSRYTHCPLPSCPNSKGHRVKRLRPLPMKLPDLPRHIKDPIIAEFRKYTILKLSMYANIGHLQLWLLLGNLKQQAGSIKM